MSEECPELSRQWQTDVRSIKALNNSSCVDEFSLVLLALLTWLRNYKRFYFESFTEFDVMPEERHELLRIWRVFGKFF